MDRSEHRPRERDVHGSYRGAGTRPHRGRIHAQLRHRRAGTAGQGRIRQLPVGLRGLHRRRSGREGPRTRRDHRYRDQPPALLHHHGRVGPRLRRAHLPARGRPAVGRQAGSGDQAVERLDPRRRPRPAADQPRRAFRRRDRAALAGRGERPRRRALGRHPAGHPRPPVRRHDVQLPEPDPGTSPRSSAAPPRCSTRTSSRRSTAPGGTRSSGPTGTRRSSGRRSGT